MVVRVYRANEKYYCEFFAEGDITHACCVNEFEALYHMLAPVPKYYGLEVVSNMLL